MIVNKDVSLPKYAIRYAVILAAVPTLYNIVLVMLGLHLDYQWYGEGIGESYTKARTYLLPLLLFIAIILYRKKATPPFTLKTILKLGLWIFTISSIIVIAYNLIFRFIIAPDFAADFYELNRAQIYDILLEGHQEIGRDYTSEDMDRHIATNGNVWNMLFANLVLNLVFTLFFSLVFGLFLRSKRSKDKDATTP